IELRGIVLCQRQPVRGQPIHLLPDSRRDPLDPGVDRLVFAPFDSAVVGRVPGLVEIIVIYVMERHGEVSDIVSGETQWVAGVLVPAPALPILAQGGDDGSVEVSLAVAAAVVVAYLVKDHVNGDDDPFGVVTVVVAVFIATRL